MTSQTPNARDYVNLAAFISSLGVISAMYFSISGRALEIERRLSRVEGNLERIGRGTTNQNYLYPKDRSFGGGH